MSLPGVLLPLCLLITIMVAHEHKVLSLLPDVFEGKATHCSVSSCLEVSMRTAVLLTHFLLASADAGELSVSTLLSHQLRWRLSHAHPGEITALAFAPDGLFLASGGQDGLVQVWDTDTGALRHTFCHGSAVEHLHWSANHLLASTSGAQIQVWRVLPSAPVS